MLFLLYQWEYLFQIGFTKSPDWDQFLWQDEQLLITRQKKRGLLEVKFFLDQATSLYHEVHVLAISFLKLPQQDNKWRSKCKMYLIRPVLALSNLKIGSWKEEQTLLTLVFTNTEGKNGLSSLEVKM